MVSVVIWVVAPLLAVLVLVYRCTMLVVLLLVVLVLVLVVLLLVFVR